MAERAKKFVERAPRYVLRPQDRSDMRFSLEHSHGAGGIERTLMINLSETGAAFVVEHSNAPKIGDRIKVEVPIPQGDRVAWFGKVVRTSVFQPRGWFTRGGFEAEDRVLVALTFEEMPEQHTRAIRRGLNKSFLRAVRDQEYRTWNYYRAAIVENIWTVLLYAAVATAAFGMLYYLTRPSANYDEKRGAPWGERFKFF